MSRIKRGDSESAKIRTIRNYLEAVGGSLTLEYTLEYVVGDQRIHVA
ncbi:MAG TPA: hypothetical protein VN621_11800 [Arthrobacter sp.]|nr:hypothetical protein [Arthrobacter sp.]